MAVIRRTSATHLAGWLLLVAILCGALAVTAFALTRGSGPVPPSRPLAVAIRDAISGPPVAGVTADISLSDHLIPGSSTTSRLGPLAGATARVWAAGGRARIDLNTSTANLQLAVDRGRLTVLDSRDRVAYVLPLSGGAKHAGASSNADHGLPTVAQIQRVLNQVSQRMALSGALPGDIAGRPEYTVRASPRRDGGLFGAFVLAWDAGHGIPLRFAIVPRGSSTPAIDLTVTHVHFGPVAASDLALHLPAGTRVDDLHRPTAADLARLHSHSGPRVSGAQAVSTHVSFRLAAPAAIEGLRRRSARLIGSGRDAGALLVYGRGLGAIFVLEQPVSGRAGGPLSSLPRVSVGGVAGHELQTTLGTLIQVTRGGVTTTVVGSRPAHTIAAAVRSLT